MANDFEHGMHQPVMDVLGPELGAHWRSRTRPAFALRAPYSLTSEEEEWPVVGQMYGPPSLPVDMPWPEGEDEAYGLEGLYPLTHLATIDCAALPKGVLDFDLPEDGSLIFFAGDPCFEGRSSKPGATCRLFYIPGSTKTAVRETPEEGIEFESSRPLRLISSYDSRLCWYFIEEKYPLPEIDEDSLAKAFDVWNYSRVGGMDIQIGGHQDPIHGLSRVRTPDGDLRGPHGPNPDEDISVLLASIRDTATNDLVLHCFIRLRDLKQHRFDDIYYDPEW
ncbi:DUF1963 domain-containing protein [Streptomyces gramineus]|uniref:DUF1963 domain-containing protein n=1 Tax=Streptomyces gramineus TaxID=910542 RepID=UPI00398AADEC